MNIIPAEKLQFNYIMLCIFLNTFSFSTVSLCCSWKWPAVKLLVLSFNVHQFTASLDTCDQNASGENARKKVTSRHCGHFHYTCWHLHSLEGKLLVAITKWMWANFAAHSTAFGWSASAAVTGQNKAKVGSPQHQRSTWTLQRGIDFVCSYEEVQAPLKVKFRHWCVCAHPKVTLFFSTENNLHNRHLLRQTSGQRSFSKKKGLFLRVHGYSLQTAS